MLVNALQQWASWVMPSCQLLLSSPLDQRLMLFHSRPPLQQLLLFSLCLYSYPSPPSLNTITTPDINKMRQDLFFHFVPLTTHCAWLIGLSRLFSLSRRSWTNGVSVTPARRLDVAVTRPASWVSLRGLTAYWALTDSGLSEEARVNKRLMSTCLKTFRELIWIRGRRFFLPS